MRKYRAEQYWDRANFLSTFILCSLLIFSSPTTTRPGEMAGREFEKLSGNH